MIKLVYEALSRVAISSHDDCAGAFGAFMWGTSALATGNQPDSIFAMLLEALVFKGSSQSYPKHATTSVGTSRQFVGVISADGEDPRRSYLREIQLDHSDLRSNSSRWRAGRRWRTPGDLKENLFERDPGLDAATADLYTAAAAVVQEATAASQPYARKCRLPQEAQASFEERSL